MVFQAQHDAVFARDRDNLLDAPDHPFNALLARHFWIALAAEHATDCALPTQQARNADHVGFAVDGALPSRFVGIGEIGRATQHGHGETGRGDGVPDAVDIAVVQAGEEALVHLQAFGGQLASHRYPLEDSHAASGDVFQVAFGESGDLHGIGWNWLRQRARCRRR